ncbi:LysR family transcriptional regulator [Allorhizocola rhizosphaerae]|uniref:LysR family transcriptional regulator n=1 Tax=Allorhizocola rhizosphaerae TaxID=1872709 RepID=UPI000E3CEE56|nr:LysR family transcriptional regulator [Allorhizocola rhizosphaerae]
MIELSRLKALDALARCGTVHAAAAALCLTPSAISQQLAKLERETGTKLCEKDGRGLRLTDAGRVLAANAVAILDQLEQAEAALAAHHTTVSGRVTIASFATACRALLPHALAALGNDHPALTTSLIEVNPYEAVAAVSRGAADIAVLDDWPEIGLDLAGLSYVELGLDIADLIVPSGHRLAASTTTDLAQVRGERWIASPPHTICHDWLLRVLPGVAPDYLVGEFETQLTLIAAGLGVALIPRLARTGLPDGVTAINVDPTPVRRVIVAWRSSSAARPAIRAATEALQNAWDQRTSSRSTTKMRVSPGLMAAPAPRLP